MLGCLFLVLMLALFAVVDGFAGAAYAWLGVAEIDSEWLQMGTLGLFILALMAALKIAEVRFERERRRESDESTGRTPPR